MTTRQKKEKERASFTRSDFLNRLSDLHLELDSMEEEALELELVQMYELFLALNPLLDEVKKMKIAVSELLYKS